MIYAFDLESSYDGEKAWCWSWGLLSGDGEYRHGNGTNLSSLFSCVSDGSDVWVHNLSFDGEFLINELVNMGFSLQYQSFNKKGFREFTISEDSTGIRSISVAYRFKSFTFRDSLRIFRCKLSQIPEICGFNQQKLRMEEGYINRPINHTPSQDEQEYQFADCEILIKAIKWLGEMGCVGFTAGSIALNEFKRFHGRSPFIPISHGERAMLRSLYSGGCCAINPQHRQGAVIVMQKPGKVFDNNSIYPHKVKDYELPVAVKGVFHGKNSCIGLKAFHVIMRNMRLNPGKLPMLVTPFTGSGRVNIETHEGWLFEDELEVLHSCYNVEHTDIIQTTLFEQANIDGGFVDKWYQIKRCAQNESLRSMAKLVLNNLTGKFGQSPEQDVYRRRVNDGVSSFIHDVVLNDINKWHFMPAVARITSLSRMQLEKVVSTVDDWYYTDTDSIHTPDDLPPSIVHPKDLGKWKMESTFLRAMYIKPKSYWETGGSTEVLRHAGISNDATLSKVEAIKKGRKTEIIYTPTGEKIGSHNMYSGNVFCTKQMKRVKGGAAIVNVFKKL